MTRMFVYGPLVIEPATQFIKRNHHVLLICTVLLKAFVSRFDIRKRRPVHPHLEMAIQRSDSRDVDQSQVVACKRWLARGLLIQKTKIWSAQRQAFVDGCAVSLLRRGAVKASERSSRKCKTT